jgi:hypothetical protein
MRQRNGRVYGNGHAYKLALMKLVAIPIVCYRFTEDCHIPLSFEVDSNVKPQQRNFPFLHSEVQYPFEQNQNSIARA